MAIITATKQEVLEYYESDRLSQSHLKLLLKGVDSFLNNQKDEKELLYYEEKEHFIIGSGVDCILTGEENQFEEDYYISQIEEKPSETIVSIVNQVFDLITEMYNDGQAAMTLPSTLIVLDFYNSIEDSIINQIILNACNSHKYSSNWNDTTRVNKIKEKGGLYLEDLCKAYGKQVLSREENTTIQEIVISLRTNSRTQQYFGRDRAERLSESVTIYYQLPIYFEYRGIECKALLDMVMVDNDSKLIIPIDLKTMAGGNLKFLESLRKFRYDIQGVWYTKALEFKFNGYTIQPFQFIVESTTYVGKPLIYKLSDSLLRIGLDGRPIFKLVDTDLFNAESLKDNVLADMILVKEIKGVNQLTDEYLWYEENGWEEERIVAENNGVLTIDWNDII